MTTNYKAKTERMAATLLTADVDSAFRKVDGVANTPTPPRKVVPRRVLQYNFR